MGGGPAGLAAAYFAKQKGIPFTVYEAAPMVGGNCTTFEHNGFRYDSGAHRLHDKDADITHIYKQLLGDDLLAIDIPSAVFYKGKFIDFPLSPLDLLVKLGPLKIARATIDLFASRLKGGQVACNFESQAVHNYGRYLADMFLLHYTEKLWGRPASQLSVQVSGARLKGLDLQTFFKETFSDKKDKVQHMDGRFFYPRYGIGQLMDKLEQYCGPENFRKDARITRLFHQEGKIDALEVNGTERIPVNEIISTLPVNLLPQLFFPLTGQKVLDACKDISFRHLVLVTILLDKVQVSTHATLYFTTPGWVFTRLVEPRNRSADMSPYGKTSLVAEVPVGQFNEKDIPALEQKVKEQLSQTGLIKESEILEIVSCFIPNAYPILETGLEEKHQAILSFCNSFNNLQLTGRNATFRYTHIHDQFLAARALF